MIDSGNGSCSTMAIPEAEPYHMDQAPHRRDLLCQRLHKKVLLFSAVQSGASPAVGTGDVHAIQLQSIDQDFPLLCL